MIAIEVTEVQAFDVLLTSGKKITASVNKLCQSLIRGGRAASYSHASIFLTPFLLAESDVNPGVVLTNLFGPCPDPHTNAGFSSVQQPRIVSRSDGAKVRLFALLPGVDAACIRRYKPIDGIDVREFVRLTHHLTSVLAGSYLAQYPALIRLAGTAGIISASVLTVLEQVGAVFEKKGITGPFCSELVTILLAAANSAILKELGMPENVAPSDIHHAQLFRTIVESNDSNELAGQEFEGVLNLLEPYMSPNEIAMQSRRAEILQVTKKMELRVTDVDTDWENYYDSLREEIRWGPLRHLNDRIVDGAMVSKWLIDSNKCTETCPLNKKDATSEFRPRFSKSRDGDPHEPCIDVRGCSAVTPRIWGDLLLLLGRRDEERLRNDMEFT